MFSYSFMYFILKSVLINFIISKININVLNILTSFTSKPRHSTTCKGAIEVRSLESNWSRSLSAEVDHLWHSCLQGTAKLSSYLTNTIKKNDNCYNGKKSQSVLSVQIVLNIYMLAKCFSCNNSERKINKMHLYKHLEFLWSNLQFLTFQL